MVYTLTEERIKFFNAEYISNNTIDNRILVAQGIELYTNEIFVRYSDEFPSYFISPYQRVISYKNGIVKQIKLLPQGKDGKYLGFSMSDNQQKTTLTINRAIADVFCPNYWTSKQLNAHHCDINPRNNLLTNIVLLPTDLHSQLHKIKSIELLQNGTIIPISNPLELLIISNGVLTLEDIIYPDKKGKRKPIKSNGSRTVFNIKNYQIAYRFYPKADKTKNKKKK